MYSLYVTLLFRQKCTSTYMYNCTFVHKASFISAYLSIVTVGLKIMLGCEEMHSVVFRIRGILLQIRIRGSVPLTNESGRIRIRNRIQIQLRILLFYQ
jgi:hypothetical protein